MKARNLLEKIARSIAWLTLLTSANVWSAESVGAAANGCLIHGIPLPLEGTGYQIVRTERARFYGHPALLDLIQKMGEEASRKQWGILLIGDLSQQQGGPMPYGHSSHQTGLDVDILFGTARSPLDSDARSTPPEIEMVQPDEKHLNAHVWNSNQIDMLRFAAEHPGTERIFVHPAIKMTLCKTASGNREWLRKLRPWWGHTEHFHVRLRCPSDSPDCIRQSALPNGDGCDATLSWWLHAKPAVPQTAKSRPIPPTRCTAAPQN